MAQTLAERLSDTTKTKLHDGFVADLRRIAELNSVDVNHVWERWQKYTQECRWADQSPAMFEFCQWNNWKQD